MSVVKVFVLGMVVFGSILGTSRGDSIRSTNHHERHHRAEAQQPVHAVLVNRAISFENLAKSQPGDRAANVAPSTPVGWAASVAPTPTSVPTSFPISISGPSSFVALPPPTTTSPTPSADAFINFGSGPYAEAKTLTSGNAQPFFNSPVFTHLFAGNSPTSADVATFENQVLATVQKTYNSAGLGIKLTDDPTVAAAHALSVVSGTSYSANPSAIGITTVGGNGFSFIDKFTGVQSEPDLATAIGHNLAHELMHAFGIANHPEQTGPYVDAATTSLATLINPDTGFSPTAANLLSTLNFSAVGSSVTSGAQKIDGDQILASSSASAVPEPSTVILWVAAGGLVFGRTLRSRRRSGQLGDDPTP